MQHIEYNTREYLQLDRSGFVWEKNPLIFMARDAIASCVHDSNKETGMFNELDVVLQSMLSLAYYKPIDVWANLGHQQDYAHALKAPYADGSHELISGLTVSIQSEDIILNQDLIKSVADMNYARAIKRQSTIEASESADIIGALSLDKRLFSSDAALTRKNREFMSGERGRVMFVREKHSATPVVMKTVDLETSRFYAENFHYLHKAREDEAVAFGAYADDSPYPFAWVSYSPIGSSSERDIASLSGVNPETAFEMTRAWNTSWSPKNTMSLLFSYAHRMLQQNKVGLEQVKVSGVVTAINPNMGFSGMAFSGVDFAVTGLKPTNHKFLIDEHGRPQYMLRRDISASLGIPEESLNLSDRYSESNMPLLPTNVMAVIFDGKGNVRTKPQTPIYIVPPQ